MELPVISQSYIVRPLTYKLVELWNVNEIGQSGKLAVFLLHSYQLRFLLSSQPASPRKGPTFLHPKSNPVLEMADNV